MHAVADWSGKAGYPTFTECQKYVRNGTTDDAAYCSACKKPSWETDAAKAAAALADRKKNLGPCPTDCVCAGMMSLSDFDLTNMACGVVCVS